MAQDPDPRLLLSHQTPPGVDYRRPWSVCTILWDWTRQTCRREHLRWAISTAQLRADVLFSTHLRTSPASCCATDLTHLAVQRPIPRHTWICFLTARGEPPAAQLRACHSTSTPLQDLLIAHSQPHRSNSLIFLDWPSSHGCCLPKRA